MPRGSAKAAAGDVIDASGTVPAVVPSFPLSDPDNEVAKNIYGRKSRPAVLARLALFMRTCLIHRKSKSVGIGKLKDWSGLFN